MLCTLAMSSSTALPLPCLFSTTLEMMAELKMVQATAADKKLIQNEFGTFYKRMISFWNHLRYLLEYHLIFWRTFVHKTVPFFQLPFLLFENLYMEIYAVVCFHVKSVKNLVGLLNHVEFYVRDRVGISFIDDMNWLSEYIIQAIAVAVNSISSDVSTYISSLVSNEKILHIFAIMQSDKRCYFGKPCDPEYLFTYQEPSDVKLKDVGIKLRLNPHSLHSSSYIPTLAIPAIAYFGFEIAIRRSIFYWFRYFETHSMKEYLGGLPFIGDRIAEDIWFAQVSYRVIVEDLSLYRERVRQILEANAADCFGKFGFYQEMAHLFMSRLTRVLKDQFDDHSGIWRSRFLLEQYFALYVQNVRVHAPMYSVSEIMIIAQQYLGVHLTECKELDSIEWTKSFTENRRALANTCFDLFSVRKANDLIEDRMLIVFSSLLLSNALIELQSIEYTENFGNKIPLQFFEYLKPLITKYKLKLNPNNVLEWIRSMDYVMEGCYPSFRFKDIYNPFSDWLISKLSDSDRAYTTLVAHAMVLNKKVPSQSLVCDIANKLETLAKAIKIPQSPETLYQERNRFQKELEVMFAMNKCYHLIRFIINETKIESAWKNFLFRPVSMLAVGIEQEDWAFIESSRFMNSLPAFIRCFTPKPFSAESRSKPKALYVEESQNVPSQASSFSNPKPKTSGLKSGFFKSSPKATASDTPQLKNEASGDDEEEIRARILKLKEIFRKFDYVSAMLIRDEPLNQYEIDDLENAVKGAVGAYSSTIQSRLKEIDLKPKIYNEVLSDILTRIGNG
jgi:hypothetical protein